MNNLAADFSYYKAKKLKKGFNTYSRSKLKGDKGSNGESIKGDKGDTGHNGKDGLNGRDGIKGDKGESIKGDTGSIGLQGAKGDIGMPPEHRWDGTKLSFQLPTGGWGNYVELKGDVGKDGKTPNIPNIPKVFSTSIDAIKGLRIELDSLKEENMQYDKLIDTIDTVKYIGEALPSTKKSDALWRIKKVDLTTEDINIVWADGTGKFVKVWDDRLSYDYIVEA